MEKEKKEKRFNLKISKQLHDQVTEKFGKHSISEIVRQQFTRAIKNDELKEYRCCICGNKHEYNIESLWLSAPLVPEKKSIEPITFYILCPKCRERILKDNHNKTPDFGTFTKLSDNEAKIFQKILKLLFTENGGQGLLEVIQKLCKYYPNKWNYNGSGVVESQEFDMENLKKQFQHINASKKA